jgi:Uma2 family endonuclease
MVDATTTRPMTLAEYKALPETTRPQELIYGELLVSPTPKPEHQLIVYDIAKVIDNATSEGQMYLSPLDVYIDGHALQPDVFWVAPDSKCAIGADGYHEGPPDLVVEIVSPSSRRRDRVEKFNIYEQAGVREYWLVEPDGQLIEVFVLRDQRFIRQSAYTQGMRFKSMTLAADINIDHIFPPPAAE